MLGSAFLPKDVVALCYRLGVAEWEKSSAEDSDRC